MRFAAKVDANHGEIVAALRKAGVSVQSMAAIGKGCPDLLAAKGGKVWTIEIKGPKGKLTPDQVEWIDKWKGDVHIIRTVDEALTLVGVL